MVSSRLVGFEIKYMLLAAELDSYHYMGISRDTMVFQPTATQSDKSSSNVHPTLVCKMRLR